MIVISRILLVDYLGDECRMALICFLPGNVQYLS